MRLHTTVLVTAPITAMLASPAFAAVPNTDDPNVYGSLVSSYDPLANGYIWPSTSGHSPVIPPDHTQLVSEVHTVTSPVTVGSGPNTVDLVPGDMVWSYTITLVQASTESIAAIEKFSVAGLPALGNGQDTMDASLIKDTGWYVNGATEPNSIQVSNAGAWGAYVDFNWLGAGSGYFSNSETITLMMFTGPADIGYGNGNFTAAPAQTGFLEVVQGDGVAPKVLIPITPVPTPGAVSLLALGGLVAARRRR